MPPLRTTTAPYEAEVVPSHDWTEVPLVYVNHTLVQASEDEFTLLFFQANPPFVRTPEEAKAITEIPARCIARFVLAPANADRLYQTLKGAVEGLEAARALRRLKENQ